MAKQDAITTEEFNKVRNSLSQPDLAAHCERTFDCRPIIDPNMVSVIKRLQKDFQLTNFVETGTFRGETSHIMSFLFDRVFTCDVKDWPKRVEYHFATNIVAELKSSPDFLRSHLNEIRSKSMFYLDAHWEDYWPLKDELTIISKECENPVFVIDDFDAGNNLQYDSYGGQKLDFGLVTSFLSPDYKYFINNWSNRQRGVIFLFPPTVDYGCRIADHDQYNESHSLWNRI